MLPNGYKNKIYLQNTFDSKVPSLRCQAFNSLFSSFRLGLCGQRNQGFFRFSGNCMDWLYPSLEFGHKLTKWSRKNVCHILSHLLLVHVLSSGYAFTEWHTCLILSKNFSMLQSEQFVEINGMFEISW